MRPAVRPGAVIHDADGGRPPRPQDGRLRAPSWRRTGPASRPPSIPSASTGDNSGQAVPRRARARPRGSGWRRASPSGPPSPAVTDTIPGATLRPCGEDAFVVEFGDAIDPAAGARVGALTKALDAAAPPGLVEVVPDLGTQLRSLTGSDDEPGKGHPLERIAAFCRATPQPPRASGRNSLSASRVRRREDIAEAAEGLGIPQEELRAPASSRPTCGSACTGLRAGICISLGPRPGTRHPAPAESPRAPMAPGSVIIAGGMAALNSASLPTG